MLLQKKRPVKRLLRQAMCNSHFLWGTAQHTHPASAFTAARLAEAVAIPRLRFDEVWTGTTTCPSSSSSASRTQPHTNQRYASCGHPTGGTRQHAPVTAPSEGTQGQQWVPSSSPARRSHNSKHDVQRPRHLARLTVGLTQQMTDQARKFLVHKFRGDTQNVLAALVLDNAQML